MAQPQNGYVFVYKPKNLDALHKWKESRDELWDVEVFTPHENDVFVSLGYREIDGSRCKVWRLSGTDCYLAQIHITASDRP
jgi:hypothetical protein